MRRRGGTTRRNGQRRSQGDLIEETSCHVHTKDTHTSQSYSFLLAFLRCALSRAPTLSLSLCLSLARSCLLMMRLRTKAASTMSKSSTLTYCSPQRLACLPLHAVDHAARYHCWHVRGAVSARIVSVEKLQVIHSTLNATLLIFAYINNIGQGTFVLSLLLLESSQFTFDCAQRRKLGRHPAEHNPL